MKYKKLYIFITASVLSFLPLLASADSLSSFTFRDIILYAIDIVQILIPICSILALVVFFWGISKTILGSGAPAEIQKGRSYMIGGIAALFIFLSLRTILSFASAQLEFGQIGYPLLPTGQATVPAPVSFPSLGN